MFLAQVISFGNAWKTLVEQHPDRLAEMREAIASITPEAIANAQPARDSSYQQEPGVTRYRLDGLWTTLMQEYNWEESTWSFRGAGGRPIQLRGLGHVKGQVSVVLHRHREVLNRWLYTLAPIATRNGVIAVPVSVSLLHPTEEALFGRRPMLMSLLERTKEELLALSPLSHANPFLLLGLSLQQGPLEVIEIESDVESTIEHIVINRSIEFPPEYHQAGLGILSYFGTVLREKYPDQNAKVRIEQDGLRVRLVIESENGEREVIEKALQEYELVVRGESKPEAFFDSKARVLELKNELRIAQVRIESQKDLIAYQGEEIASLRSLFGHALSTTRQQPLTVTVSPTILAAANSSQTVLQSVPIASEYIQSLTALASTDPDLHLRLLDLDESVSALTHKNTVDGARESSGMKKLKRFLDDASTAGSAVNSFLSKCSEGVDLVQKLGRRYNDIAEWCGAPQVPKVFLGKDV